METNLGMLEKQQFFALERINMDVASGKLLEGHKFRTEMRERERFKDEMQKERVKWLNRPKYWSQLWSYIEWLIIFQMIGALIMRIMFLRAVGNPFAGEKKIDISTAVYVNYGLLAWYNTMALNLDCLTVFVAFFKFFKYFVLQRNMYAIWVTLERAAPDIILFFSVSIRAAFYSCSCGPKLLTVTFRP
jgi:hypothetical protein